MTHYDEGTIHAWLDGALNDDETAEIERHVASCGECAARVTEARGLLAGASRILLALDDVPGGVVPAGTAGTAGTTKNQRGGRRWMGPAAWAIAAMLVLAVGVKTVGRFDGTTVGQSDSLRVRQSDSQTVGQTMTTATAGEGAKKGQDAAKAVGGVSGQSKRVSAAPTARMDAPALAPARKSVPVVSGAAAGGKPAPSSTAAAAMETAAKAKGGDSAAALVVRQMVAADSIGARRADAMRGQAMALSNVVVTGVADAARPAAAPTAQLRGTVAPSLGATPVCYADGHNIFVLDSAQAAQERPGMAADMTAPVRRILRDTSGTVGTWERLGTDSLALFVGGRVWRGAVAPAGVVVEGRIWTRTECRRVGG